MIALNGELIESYDAKILEKSKGLFSLHVSDLSKDRNAAAVLPCSFLPVLS